jgi:hypothetical protein
LISQFDVEIEIMGYCWYGELSVVADYHKVERVRFLEVFGLWSILLLLRKSCARCGKVIHQVDIQNNFNSETLTKVTSKPSSHLRVLKYGDRNSFSALVYHQKHEHKHSTQNTFSFLSFKNTLFFVYESSQCGVQFVRRSKFKETTTNTDKREK